MAYQINQAFIEGNVGRDATTGKTKNDDTYTRWSVANTQGEKTIWVSCVMFGEERSKLAPGIVKGAKVVVSGRIDLDTYKNADGEERAGLSMVVNSISLPPRAQREEVTASVDTEAAEVLDLDF
jgi:single-strand DNA-binding protein